MDRTAKRVSAWCHDHARQDERLAVAGDPLGRAVEGNERDPERAADRRVAEHASVARAHHGDHGRLRSGKGHVANGVRHVHGAVPAGHDPRRGPTFAGGGVARDERERDECKCDQPEHGRLLSTVVISSTPVGVARVRPQPIVAPVAASNVSMRPSARRAWTRRSPAAKPRPAIALPVRYGPRTTPYAVSYAQRSRPGLK